MADYSGKGRFGLRFRSWDSLYDTRPDSWNKLDFSTEPDPHRDHVCRPVIIGSDGRAVPGVLTQCPPNSGDHRKDGVITKIETVVEENAYRVQPVNPYMRQYGPGERKMGFPGGLFQKTRAEYYGSEPAVLSEGGPARPGPIGWKSPPEMALGRVTNDIGTAAEYLVGPVGPASLQPSPGRYSSGFQPKKVTATIDSRDAVKRYGGQYI